MKTFQLSEVEKIARLLIDTGCTIFTFYGPLGAGKTTLVKAFLRGKGVEANVTSPTFAYVNSYKNKEGDVFHHFDLYRLNSLEDFLATGFDEYLHDEATVLVEWPAIIEDLLKEKEIMPRVCRVELEYDPDDLGVRGVEIFSGKRK